MINYLKSILPRIQQYSNKLDNIATFADIPWAFLDNDGQKVTYIFRQNNELLVSKQGEVVTGKWEYLPVIQSLLIEHESRKRMYNQGFLNEAVMLLRKDGTDEIFPLGNVQLLPDLNIEKYLEEYLMPKLEAQSNGDSKETSENCIYELQDGRKIQIIKKWEKGNCFDQGNEVKFLGGEKQGIEYSEHDILQLVEPFEIHLESAKIKQAYKWKSYKTETGIAIEIRCSYEYYHDGRIAYLDDVIREGKRVRGLINLPENQWVKLNGNDRRIMIADGKVAKMEMDDYRPLLFWVGIIIVLMVLLKFILMT